MSPRCSFDGRRLLRRARHAAARQGRDGRRDLTDLALLNDAGLDPLALGRTQLADVYLTRAPQKPASDKLQVLVSALPAVDKKTYALIPDRLAQPDMRAALVACWEAYNQAT